MRGMIGSLPAGKIHKQKPTQTTQMKLKHLFTLLAAFAITVPAIAGDEDTPLGKEMEKISKALKSVNRDIADASKKADNVKKVADAKVACAAASKFEPAKTKEVPAAEKAKFLEGFNASMQEMGKELDALKAAVEAGKTDEAKSLIEKLNAGKKEAHKKYKAD